MFNEYLIYGGVGFCILLIAYLALKDSLYPYVAAGPLFTQAELNFYRFLTQAVGGRALVFGKVRIADVIQPKPSLKGSKRITALNKVSQKHFDYVLVDPQTMEVLAAVELNDKSHNQKDRAARDKLVRDAMKSCDIPLIEVPAARKYDVATLNTLLATALVGKARPAPVPEQQVKHNPIKQTKAQQTQLSKTTTSISPEKTVPANLEASPITVAAVTTVLAIEPLEPELVTTSPTKDAPAVINESTIALAPSPDVPTIFSREVIEQMEREDEELNSVSTSDMRVDYENN